MSCSDCTIKADGPVQRKVLITLLLINGVMFVAEIVTGIIADSTGLIADSLDMLADALVYAIGLYAVGRSKLTKIKAARWSGVFQILLALGVMADVTRRLIFGSEPEPILILVVGAIALCANLVCLKLIAAHRRGEVHMRASWIFSKNDVLANLGVIVAGLLVHMTGTRWADLVIGCVIAVIVLRGGIHILRDAASERESQE